MVGLYLNVFKTKILFFLKCPINEHPHDDEGQLIEQVTSIKYLEGNINSQCNPKNEILSWIEHA